MIPSIPGDLFKFWDFIASSSSLFFIRDPIFSFWSSFKVGGLFFQDILLYCCQGCFVKYKDLGKIFVFHLICLVFQYILCYYFLF